MSVPQPPQGRQPASSLDVNTTGSPPHGGSLPSALPIHSTASSEPSVARGRGLSSASTRSLSPRIQTHALPTKQGSGLDGGLERDTSLSYNHHRQTSIVHGVQHSHNASFVTTPNTSPLSPQVIASAGHAGASVVDSPAAAHDELKTMSPSSLNSGAVCGSLRYASSTSTLNGSTGTGTTVVGERSSHEGQAGTPQRRPERMDSGKIKRDLPPHRSLSRHHQHQLQDTKTVGEYALHHLFTSFIAEVEKKLDQCIASHTYSEPRIESMCGPGVDSRFDQLISALGHIARQKPRPIIDSLMYWRKAKADYANQARVELSQVGLLWHDELALAKNVQSRGRTPTLNGHPSRRITESQAPNGDSVDANTAVLTATPNNASRQVAVAQADRRSAISVYLLCRVLIEVVGQSTLACITKENEERLEDIIYSQLHGADPESLSTSSIKLANWAIFGQLLGVMSDINFQSVSNRFLHDLDVLQTALNYKGHTNQDHEGKAVLLIHSMRWLRVKSQPEDAWEMSCELLRSLAKFFVAIHGHPIKYAYCQLLEALLLPIAEKADLELNVPKWRDVIDTLRPRLNQLLMKPKHWHNAFPLMSVILCVAPLDLFTTQWLQLVLTSQARLKERTTRATALKAICRLVWRYLYRTTEAPNVTAKKLDDIIKLVFQPGKRSYLSTDESIAEPLIQLIRIIGYKHQDLCFRTIIFPLMNAESFLSGRELKADNLEPERMVIGIRAFLAIMADLEKTEQPPFPVTFESDVFNETSTTVPLPLSPRPLPHNNKSSHREERLSRPVITSGFGDVAKESYVKFCKILGEITIICDNTFGGQAVLDEKFASQTPKTPMADAFSFSRSRDDHTNATDPRQGFYDLLHVAVRALPRCLSPHIPFNSLVNLLCTGTAHVQSHVATSSAQSLKSIARQSHAQQVTIGLARFIFNFDDRYSTMSDGGMLGPGHIESTLRLYVELLQIWIENLKQKTKKAAFDLAEDSNSGNRGAQLDLSGVWAHVDEIESHGLFFLCSPSRRVRSFAVTVLRLVTEFDTALGKDSTRIIRILQGSPQRVMDVNDEKLSVAERSRLQRGMRKSNIHSTLVELCSSDVAYDSTLWFKVFPNLIRISFETCPFAVALTRDIVCARLSQMHKAVGALAEGTRSHQYSALEAAFVPSRTVGRLTTTPPEVVIEQWKLHLIFACTTLTNTRTQQTAAAQDSQHMRKSSKSSQHNRDKIVSAGELFSKVMPLLRVTNASIRDAVVVGLGSINMNLYRTLLESMQPSVTICNDEAKMRLGRHQRTASSPRRNHRTDHLRTEVTHIYKLTSHFLHTRETYNDDWTLNNLITYTKDLRLFLNDAEVQNEWGFQKLRTHYCGLVEILYEGVKNTKDPLRWMPFQSRKAAFALMEDWCGYSPNQNQIRQREDSMRRSVLDREHDMGNKGIVTASMEIEKRDLRTAALSSMAALCGGPVSITTESKVNLQFDVRRMLSWIDTIFDTVSDKTHAIGRRALKNLITHNREHAYLLGRSIEMCYIAKSPKALASYFEVVTQILTESDDHMPPFWRVLCAGLYTLGNDSSEIRTKSVRLLRVLEERLRKSSKLQDLDISVSDKTTAVYKAAQFEISLRLTKQHAEMAFHVFSEFSTYFKILQPDHQRNMVAAMLPWIQTIELQLDPNGGPTATSYMLLVNLFEITVRCSTALHNEILALWQALATGPHAGNVQLVLDFIINLCLEKKEQNFVDYAKQIVVFLSGTPAGLKVVDFLLLQINPKAMVVEKRETAPVPQDFVSLPYLADLSQVLPIGSGNKPAGLSLGQLCLILLVDLVVSPNKLPPAKVPLLLQVVLVLWDHYTPLVQDQAREMLVHLIHELVISQIDDRTTDPDKGAIEDLIDSIRRHESKVVWSYDDNNGEADNDNDIRVPQAMSFLTEEVVKVFAHTHPSLREDWGKMTLTWATSCAVRHIACRSFQIFRCVLTTLDPQMLADMLARLSNTIADDNNDYLTFSMEILTTIKTIVEALEPVDLIKYPQLFWTTAACLDTIFEREFMESLSMLERLLDKLDLSDPAVIKLLIGSQPPKWEGMFEGLQSPVYKGLRSRVCLDRSVHVLDRLTALPSSELVGNDSRLLFAVLANLPRYLRFSEQGTVDPSCISSAELLAGVAEGQGHDELARALQRFATTRYRADKEFLSQTVSGLRSAFFPEFEYKCLTFLMGLLTNPLPWFRTKTMQLLCVIAPEIDMRKPEITSHGSDLISPLLRLLQTEYCSQALEVLDNIMTMSGTPMDNKHLRMSMAGAHSNRATRKEYESTKSLYGIPEETGWSIPMPAVYSRMTRSNVHAVFYTCASTEATGVEEAATPEIEFHEEYQYSYFPDRTATMMSDDARGDGNMGELVMKLDSLDDFFEDSVSEETLTRQNSHALAAQAARYVNGTGGVREDLYDQQTLPILHKSLQHNTSVTSFQTSFGDLKLPPASRDPEVMTPAAFNLPAMTLARPGLPPRSMTSPGQRDQYQPSQLPDLLSGDEGGDEPFSDDDSSIGRSASSDKSFSLENIIRPGHGLRSNLRSGMRRLTGGGGGGGGGPDAREKEKLRDTVRAQLLQKNPRVPKVPDMYLQNPKSADL